MNAEKVKGLWFWFGLLFLLVLGGGILWTMRPSAISPVQSPEFAQEETVGAAEVSTAEPGQSAESTVAGKMADLLGIEISALQVAVGGSRINLRYRVLDPVRATELTNWLNRAYLIDSSGQRLARPDTPTAAPLRQESGQQLRPGRTYSYFFPNPGQTVKSGDTVTLVIGALEAPDLVVR